MNIFNIGGNVTNAVDASGPAKPKNAISGVDDWRHKMGGMHRPTVMLVHADWCGHCKSMYPVWNASIGKNRSTVELRSIESSIVKLLEADANTKLPTGWNIEGFPTVVFIENGVVRDTHAGARDGLDAWIDSKAGAAIRRPVVNQNANRNANRNANPMRRTVRRKPPAHRPVRHRTVRRNSNIRRKRRKQTVRRRGKTTGRYRGARRRGHWRRTKK